MNRLNIKNNSNYQFCGMIKELISLEKKLLNSNKLEAIFLIKRKKIPIKIAEANQKCKIIIAITMLWLCKNLKMQRKKQHICSQKYSNLKKKKILGQKF